MAIKTGLPALLAASVGLASLTPSADAASDLCRHLEAQRSEAATSGNSRHLDRYDIAIAEQRQQLLLARDRTAEAGCGFAMVGAAVAYCAKLNAKIDRMEANLDKLLRHGDRFSARTGRADDQLVALLAANGCDTGESGSQRADKRLIEDIFGPAGEPTSAKETAAAAPADAQRQSIETIPAPSPAAKDMAPPPSPSIIVPETRTPPKPAAHQPMASSDMPNEGAAPHRPDPDRRIRVVGPTFLPDPEAAIDLQAPAPSQAR